MAPQRRKSGRLLARKAQNDKYDDIFSSVSAAINSQETFEDVSRRFIEENSFKDSIERFIDHKTRQITKVVLSNRRYRLQTKEDRLNGHPPDDDYEISYSKKGNRVTKQKRELPCAYCTEIAFGHMGLHMHILEKHMYRSCPECKLDSLELRKHHQCAKCGMLVDKIQQHMRKHFASSTRAGALLDCDKCRKRFPSVNELLSHSEKAHSSNASEADKKKYQRPSGLLKVNCQICAMPFESRYFRDVHFATHFQSIIDGIWDHVERIQEENADRFVANECPQCGSVFCSRKSFRTHFVHRHLIKDPDFMERLQSMQDELVPQVASDLVFIKKEIKEEVEDEPGTSSASVSPQESTENSQDAPYGAGAVVVKQEVEDVE